MVEAGRLTPRRVHRLLMVWVEDQLMLEENEDLRSGIVASVIANVNRDPKQRSEPYSPQDFMPRRRPEIPPEPMSVDQTVSFVAMLNVALGGVDLRPTR
ncbi:MAG TPA: hypothetical protein VIP09_02115 [Dehalococcoidia bacterium]